MKHFSLAQNGLLIGFGVKDFADYVPARATHLKGHENAQVHKVHEVMAAYSLVHGIFYVAAGVIGAAACMHDLSWLNLGPALPFAQYVGAGLFFYVNLFSLQQNIKLFSLAQKLAKEGKFPALANRLRISAVLGIINNIGYIFATILSFFSGTLTVAIILGCFAFFVGTLKIIYDYFFLNPKLSAVS